MNPAIQALRKALITECREKNSLDPRETDLRGDYHVNVTLTVAEIRNFLIATAETVRDGEPVKTNQVRDDLTNEHQEDQA